MDVNGLYLIIGQQQAALVELRAVLQQLQEENTALITPYSATWTTHGLQPRAMTTRTP